MQRSLVVIALASILCVTVPFALAEQRGKGGEKESKGNESHSKGNEPHSKGNEQQSKGGNKPPGGAWSEGKQSPTNRSQETAEKNKSSPHATGAEGATAAHETNKFKPQQASGKEGAAAGAAAANKEKPTTSGKEGAAAGAAAVNRNKPATSGAEGAAAGAAAANRNKPATSGAEGAAVGAAAVNRNKPAASGAEGAAAGAAVANHHDPAMSGAAGAAAGYASVRNSFDHPTLYNQQWHNDHPGAWTTAKWSTGNAWTPANYVAVAGYCGYNNSRPVSYTYGDNITYLNGNVVLDGQSVGTAEEFSQQAADLALFGQNADVGPDDEWLPLGVFALVKNEQQHPQVTLQLAVNNQGILQGNYTDTVTDHTLPIHGAIDKETQRMAWTVNNNRNFYMEAGLKNLTSGEAPALMHKYGRTEKWLLVRLEQIDSVDSVEGNPN